MKLESKLAQLGSRADEQYGGLSYPIYHATPYRHAGLHEDTGFLYSRTANPTRSVLETAIADLEGGDAGFACSTGMAAITTVLMMFSKGDHLIVSLDLYGGTYRLLESVMSRFGITATYVDTTDLERLECAFLDNTRAVFIETPTNPLMMVTDLEATAAWAHERGLVLIVDNTLMTPFFQQPLAQGADIVVHSATKYLGGHNDVLAGLVVTSTPALSETIGALLNTVGAVLGPQDCWLLMRGMKTLAVRMERHASNALAAAQWLDHHAEVATVYYPGLTSHPHKDVQDRQTSGNTGILSFRLKDPRLVPGILRSMELVFFAESLGGTETLMTYPHTQTHADIPEEIRAEVGVDDALLRLSVGLEHIDDILADLGQAFTRARRELEYDI